MAPSPTGTATVIVAVRNAGEHAGTLAERLREMTELAGVSAVVIDDGSIDGTGSVLDGLLADSPQVRLIQHDESAGVAARRNEAVAMADGEFIWFVDHDDDWSGDGLTDLLAHADGADLVCARADFRWGPGRADRRRIDGVADVASARSIDADAAAELLIGGEIHGFLWSKLFRRTVLGSEPFPHYVSQSDVVGVARALSEARVVRLIPETVYAYRREPGSITRVRTPDIGALEAAHDDVLRLVGDRTSPAARDTFTARFFCLAAVKTAVRWGVDRQQMRVTTAAAARRARGLALVGVAKNAAPLAAAILLLRIAPPLLPAALRMALFGLDSLRSLRSRATRSGNEEVDA